MSLAYEHREFCVSCGNFVDELDETTGFCLECIGSVKTRCLGCSQLFARDQPHRRLCPKCREERWLERNADRLEDYLEFGATIQFAKRSVYGENRPVCLSCNEPIKGAKNGANFCTRTTDCRRWQRRYRTLREQSIGMRLLDPAKQALAQISAEIFAERHSMHLGGSKE